MSSKIEGRHTTSSGTYEFKKKKKKAKQFHGRVEVE